MIARSMKSFDVGISTFQEGIRLLFSLHGDLREIGG